MTTNSTNLPEYERSTWSHVRTHVEIRPTPSGCGLVQFLTSPVALVRFPEEEVEPLLVGWTVVFLSMVFESLAQLDTDVIQCRFLVSVPLQNRKQVLSQNLMSVQNVSRAVKGLFRFLLFFLSFLFATRDEG